MSSYGPGIIARTNSYRIDPKSIVRREGWNPRFDFGEIEELARSIKENGVLQPLRVKRHGKEQFELIDGDRRLTAIELLMKKGVEFPDGVMAIIEDKAATDLENLVLMFEANSGKPFLPLEAAKAYRMLMDTGLTAKQVAKKLGRSEAHVKFTVALTEADTSVTEALEKGEINSVEARTIAKTKDKDKQKELVGKVKSAGKGRAEKQAVRKEVTDAVRKRVPLKKPASTAMTHERIVQFLETTERLMLEHMKQQGVSLVLELDTISKESDKNQMLYEYGAVRAIKHILGIA